MPFICIGVVNCQRFAAIPVELVSLLLTINSKNSTIEEHNSYSIIMGVISMQMMRQYSGVGHSKPKPKPSSSPMQLSKKRRFAVYPPKQYPAADKHLSRRNRRCSSPQSLQSSIEGRPPRHPDSPVSLSSSLPSLSDALHIPNDIVYTKSLDSIIDEYKNEKFPAEILARLQRQTVNDMNNCDASTNDKDEQRDEDNDTLGFSDTDTTEEEEPMGEKKESIFEFITKRLVGSLVKKKGK